MSIEEGIFMERREVFKRWLQNERHKKSGKHIPINTINNYIKSIHRISQVMYETGVISKRLYSMKNIDEVQVAVDKIRKNSTYLNLNTASENMYHKALNYYTSFIEAKNNE